MGGGKERGAFQRGETPRDNQKQNKQVDSIVKELGLSKEQRRELHYDISGEGLSYQEIREAAKELFGK